MEVAWVLGEGGLLYRGIRSPIGPPLSLFDPGAFELAPLLPAGIGPGAAPAATPAATPTGTPGASAPPADPYAPRPALLRPYGTEVVYFEVLFWSQFSNTWSTRYPALRDPEGDENPGPLTYWDSTRALLRFEGASAREYHTFKSAGSLDDPRDDVFPSAVQVTLCFREPPEAGSSSFLAQPFARGDRELVVQDAGRLVKDDSRPPSERTGFLLIDDEWVRYEGVSGNTFAITTRGARYSVEADHEAEVEVVAGATFTLVIDVPAWREDWSERRQ